VRENDSGFSSSAVVDKRYRSKTLSISPLALRENQSFHTFSAMKKLAHPISDCACLPQAGISEFAIKKDNLT
jgi:hypothetical protein